jgi:cytochrome c
MKTMLALAAAGLLAAAPAAAQAPSGETLFKQRCGTCHAIDAGGPAKLGPPLRGVVGRGAGAVADYAYSPALKRSGLTWDKASLDAYLARPAGKVPGTKMLIGLPSVEQRAAVIGYLAAQK